MEPNKTNEIINHDITRISCAACWSFSQINGKKIINGCPNCGNKDERTNARYWLNGKADYNENLMNRN